MAITKLFNQNIFSQQRTYSQNEFTTRMSRPSNRILMILENSCYPHDTRVMLEATSLVAAGFDLTVVSPTGGSKSWHETIDGVRIYRYPAPIEASGVVGYLIEYGYSLIMAFVYTWYVLLRHGFDVIHVHSPPDMNSLIPVFFQLLGKRFVYDMHDVSPELLQAQRGDGMTKGILYRGLFFFERLACRRANRLIATNETQKKIQIDRGGAAEDRCFVVRNGPNARFLSDVPAKTDLKRPGKIIIGYVGLIGHQDGVDYLIRTLHDLKSRLGRNDFFCIVIGDGPARADVERLAVELGLKDNILFTGKIPFIEVPQHIAAFDICVTPDPSNPYNDSCTTIKTMEYMALRKPTVSFRTHENAFTAGESALYADNNDVKQLSEHLSTLMSNAELRASMGAKARLRVESGLTWKHQAKELVRLYSGLLGTPKSTPLLASSDSIQFAFNGKVGELLRDSLAHDMANAKLPLKFRFFYRLRPLIPNFLRNWLQMSRNRALVLDTNWYMSNSFVTRFKQVVEVEISEQPAKPVIHPWPDNFTHAIVLTHDVEGNEGMAKMESLAKVDEQFGFRSAWFIVPHYYKLDEGLIREMQARGHEIGIHGYNHDGRLFESRARFRKRAQAINAAARRFGAKSFRAPMVHRNLDWMQELEFSADLSCFDNDPYQAMSGGVGSVWPIQVGRFVELPYSLPQDHTLIGLGEFNLETYLRKHQLVKRLRGMSMLITHPDYLNGSAKLDVYRRLLGQLAAEQDAWKALPHEVADWWQARGNSQITETELKPQIIGPAANRGKLTTLEDLFAELVTTTVG